MFGLVVKSALVFIPFVNVHASFYYIVMIVMVLRQNRDYRWVIYVMIFSLQGVPWNWNT